MSAPRVAVIVGTLSLGGAERQTYELIRYLKDMYEWHIISLLGGYWNRKYEEYKDSVYVYVLDRVSIIRQMLQIGGLLRNIQPDLIHTVATKPNAIGRLAALLAHTGAPILCSERIIYDFKPYHYRLFDKLLAPRTDAYITNSLSNAVRLRQALRIPASRINVVYNGIRMDRFPYPAPVGQHPRPTLIYVANLWPRKNHRLIIHTVNQLRTSFPRIRCLLVGEGTQRPALEASIRELDLEAHVELLGQRLNVEAILQESDIYVHTCMWEGLSNAIMEASAAGLPCVVVNGSSNSELVVHGETGYVVEPTVTTLVDSITYLLSRMDVAKRMGLAGRERMATMFSVERMALKTKGVYDQLLSG